MNKLSAVSLVVWGSLWSPMISPVAAQGVSAYGGVNSQIRDLYNQTTYSPTPVSPFVNLGINPNGLSNYQTLVKPLIDERDALRQQSANLQQMQKQMHDAAAAGDPRDPRGGNPNFQPQMSMRFMRYSHFYGGPR